MSLVLKKELFTAQTSVLNSSAIFTEDADTLTLGISGTSTSFTLEFWGSLDGIIYYPITGSKYNDAMISAISATKTGEAWELDVNAWSFFQARLTSIANGNITVQVHTTI